MFGSQIPHSLPLVWPPEELKNAKPKSWAELTTICCTAPHDSSPHQMRIMQNFLVRAVTAAEPSLTGLRRGKGGQKGDWTHLDLLGKKHASVFAHAALIILRYFDLSNIETNAELSRAESAAQTAGDATAEPTKKKRVKKRHHTKHEREAHCEEFYMMANWFGEKARNDSVFRDSMRLWDRHFFQSSHAHTQKKRKMVIMSASGAS